MAATRPLARRVPAPHRRLRLASALAAVGVRSALLPRGDGRRRGRAQVCGAARVLTALDVRVVVVLPPAAWPRSGGRLVVQGSPGLIGRLAVLTAVPRTLPGWDDLAEQTLLGRAGAPAGDADVLLPVAVRLRRSDADEWLPDGEVPGDLSEALAAPGLVAEVRLLPALRALAG